MFWKCDSKKNKRNILFGKRSVSSYLHLPSKFHLNVWLFSKSQRVDQDIIIFWNVTTLLEVTCCHLTGGAPARWSYWRLRAPVSRCLQLSSLPDKESDNYYPLGSKIHVWLVILSKKLVKTLDEKDNCNYQYSILHTFSCCWCFWLHKFWENLKACKSSNSQNTSNNKRFHLQSTRTSTKLFNFKPVIS